MSNKHIQNKHDPISDSESDKSSDEGYFSSEDENKKNSKKKNSEDKKTSSKTSSSKKKKVEVEEKNRNVKRKRVKHSPIDEFDDNVELDLSEKFTKTKKAKIAHNITLERKLLTFVDTDKKKCQYMALVFTRKSGDKTFDFNLPLSLLPNIIGGLEYISKN